MVSRYFPTEEYEARWVKLRDEMRARGFETAVVWGSSSGTFNRCADIVYLTNYYSNTSAGELDTDLWNARSYSAVIFSGDDLPELHMDEPFARHDLLATDRTEFVGSDETSCFDVVASVAAGLKRRGLEGRVAFVGSHLLPVKYFRQLEAALPGIEFVPEDELVADVRRIKSPRELACCREGGEIATRALNLQIEALLSGKSESEAGALAAGEVIRAGGAVQRMLISHGDTNQFPVRSPLTGYSTDAPVPGDLFHGWVYGPMCEGYWNDPGRTSVCGRKPDAAQKELVETCAAITEALIAEVKPGAHPADIARLGARLVEEAGGAGPMGNTWPIFGHGLGLFWERPWIGVGMCEEDPPFEADMICGIEVFLLREDVGFAGFEENLVVTAEGNDRLTTSPMLWW